MRRTANNVVWGLELGGSAVRLVRVRHNGAGYLVDKFLEAKLEDRWEKPADMGRAVEQLKAGKIDKCLVVCGADELVLFRRLSLPASGPSVLAKMARRQLEVLLPTQSEEFTVGHCSFAEVSEPGRTGVLLFAARREALASMLASGKSLGREADGLVPSIVSLANMWGRLNGLTHEPIILMDVAARCTSIALLEGQSLLQCGLIDRGGDHWTEQMAEELGISCSEAEHRKLAAASNNPDGTDDRKIAKCLENGLAQWSAQLGEVYQDWKRKIPQRKRPRRCVLFGRAGQTEGVAEQIEQAMGVKVERATAPAGLNLAEGIDFVSAAAAIGAALCTERDDWQTVNLLAKPKEERLLGRIPSWRWVALVGWLLAAVLGLYGLDKVEANRRQDSLQEAVSKTSEHGGLARQLAIGNYLETAGPSPLDVLDRISAVLPEKVLLTSWHYSRNGDVTIMGTVPKDKFLGMLDKLRNLGQAELKSGKPEKSNFEFEISMTVSRSPKAPAGESATRAEAKTAAESAGEANEKPPAKPSSEKPKADDNSKEIPAEKTPAAKADKADKAGES